MRRDRRLEGAQGRGQITLRCEQQCRTGLWIPTQRVRLPERLIGSLGVADEHAYLAHLVVGLRCGSRGESLKFRAGPSSFLLRIGPGAPQACELSSVHAANARKARDRFPLAPAGRGWGPVAAQRKLAGFAISADAVAVADPGRPRTQLPANRRRASLVQVR